MYISNNFQAWKSNETLLKTHNIYEKCEFLFKKGFTLLWYSIRHCRWVWVIRTTEMHQSSGNGRGPTQYFIIFRPPWLRILHEECPVYLSSQILTEQTEEPRSPLVPPRNSWLTAGENPAKISCDMAIRDLASNRRIDTLEPNPFGNCHISNYKKATIGCLKSSAYSCVSSCLPWKRASGVSWQARAAGHAMTPGCLWHNRIVLLLDSAEEQENFKILSIFLD